jgi:hypothetical protein
MIVRMFKPQFAPLVESGAKKQTVRPTPKRMPKIGEQFSGREWLGKPYRSKQRELVSGVIVAVETIKIGLAGHTTLAGVELREKERDNFAVCDGFSFGSEMVLWFLHQHGLPFEGIVIYWK